MKDFQATEGAFSPKREHPALQNMKFLIFFIFVDNFCPPGDPDPGYGSGSRIRIRIPDTDPLNLLNPDPIQIRNTAPRPCFIIAVTYSLRYRYVDSDLNSHLRFVFCRACAVAVTGGAAVGWGGALQ
jgi:hypothetical protein